MKKIYTFAIFCFFIVGCKKEITQPTGNEYLQNVKAALKDSMQAADFDRLDFDHTTLNRVDSISLYFLRVAFKEKNSAEDFLLVKTDREGRVEGGNIVHLEGKVVRAAFNGSVNINSLNRVKKLFSNIDKGYILSFHSLASERTQVKMPDDLPEVVIVTYVNNTPDYSSWFSLNGFYSFGHPVVETDGSYYGSLGGGTSGSYSSGGGGNYSADGPVYGETITVDLDSYANNPAIDIEQYLKCFDNIPDAGATCEVGIYADIPVDSDPNKIFDFRTGSPGHTFIQIKKVSADGNSSITQNIGFYPKTGWKNVFTNAPVDAKFVDDGNHEFNAGYTKTLNAADFKSVLTSIRYLKNMQYDIDNYNCTDWALAIFNRQGDGLDIPLYDIPGNVPSTGTSMPQGVYNQLMQMKKNNDPHADKIQIGFYKGYVTSSGGPCN